MSGVEDVSSRNKNKRWYITKLIFFFSFCFISILSTICNYNIFVFPAYFLNHFFFPFIFIWFHYVFFHFNRNISNIYILKLGKYVRERGTRSRHYWLRHQGGYLKRAKRDGDPELVCWRAKQWTQPHTLSVAIKKTYGRYRFWVYATCAIWKFDRAVGGSITVVRLFERSIW